MDYYVTGRAFTIFDNTVYKVQFSWIMQCLMFTRLKCIISIVMLLYILHIFTM